MIYLQGEEAIDPFAMPNWRKLVWSIFFSLMVGTADVGNMIGNYPSDRRERGERYSTGIFLTFPSSLSVQLSSVIEAPL